MVAVAVFKAVGVGVGARGWRLPSSRSLGWSGSSSCWCYCTAHSTFHRSVLTVCSSTLVMLAFQPCTIDRYVVTCTVMHRCCSTGRPSPFAHTVIMIEQQHSAAVLPTEVVHAVLVVAGRQAKATSSIVRGASGQLAKVSVDTNAPHKFLGTLSATSVGCRWTTTQCV